MEKLLIKYLTCPRDHSELKLNGDKLVSANENIYPVIDGIPVMLLEEAPPTHAACSASLSEESLFDNDTRNETLSDKSGIDPFVQNEVVGSCGIMYRPLQNRLTRYPIPIFPMSNGEGRVLLDVGCNWGRWCVSANKEGFTTVGIDPKLEALKAARRVVGQLGVECAFVAGDARHLPFGDDLFDVVHSYSVFQHFGKEDLELSLKEISRVLKPGGTSIVQMANKSGIRNVYIQFKRGFKQPSKFDVRYRTIGELKNIFGKYFHNISFSVDGYFSLDVQISDVDLLPLRYQIVVYCSEALKRLGKKINFPVHFADSVYIISKA